MLDLLDASPSVGAWRCEPMSIAEIDAHPDRDRIWATLMKIRREVDALIEEEIGDEDEDDTLEDGYAAARENLQAELAEIGDDLSEGMAKRIMGALA